MKVKVRNQLYPMRSSYAFHVPEFTVYEGEQVDAPKWAASGTVCLATGDPIWPVRMLDPAAIISIDESEVQTVKQTDVKVFQVAGSKGKSYTVTIGNGQRSCTCTGFAFRKHCKHIEEVDND